MDDSAARTPELTPQCCRRCRRRNECPYVRGRTLDGAVRRRCAQARLLDAEAERLLEAISRAEDAGALLRADEDLERALNWILYEDLTGTCVL